MTSDHALLQAVANGDLAGFEALYERYSARVYRFSLAVSGSRSLAEDATQETFVQVMQTADRFEQERSATAIGWIYGICRNQLRPLLRHAQRHVNPQDEGSNQGNDAAEPDASASCTELGAHYEWSRSAEVIAEAICSLPIEQREVLALCGLQELDYQSAATILAIPVGTVRSRLSRSRQALRCALAARMGGPLEEIGTDVR